MGIPNGVQEVSDMNHLMRRVGEVMTGVGLATVGFVGFSATNELISQQIEANDAIKGREAVEGNPFFTPFVYIGRLALDTGTTIITIADRFDGEVEASQDNQLVTRNTLMAYGEGAIGYNLSAAALVTGVLSISRVYDLSPRVRR